MAEYAFLHIRQGTSMKPTAKKSTVIRIRSSR